MFPKLTCLSLKIRVLYPDYIEINTRASEDIEFLFEFSTQYLTSEPSKGMRYQVEHEKGNSISRTNHVSFSIVYHKNTIGPY